MSLLFHLKVSQSLLKGCTYTMPSGPPSGYPVGPPGPGVVTSYPQSLAPPPPPSFGTQTSIDKSDEQMKNDLVNICFYPSCLSILPT